MKAWIGGARAEPVREVNECVEHGGMPLSHGHAEFQQSASTYTKISHLETLEGFTRSCADCPLHVSLQDVESCEPIAASTACSTPVKLAVNAEGVSSCSRDEGPSRGDAVMQSSFCHESVIASRALVATAAQETPQWLSNKSSRDEEDTDSIRLHLVNVLATSCADGRLDMALQQNASSEAFAQPPIVHSYRQILCNELFSASIDGRLATAIEETPGMMPVQSCDGQVLKSMTAQCAVSGGKCADDPCSVESIRRRINKVITGAFVDGRLDSALNQAKSGSPTVASRGDCKARATTLLGSSRASNVLVSPYEEVRQRASRLLRESSEDGSLVKALQSAKMGARIARRGEYCDWRTTISKVLVKSEADGSLAAVLQKVSLSNAQTRNSMMAHVDATSLWQNMRKSLLRSCPEAVASHVLRKQLPTQETTSPKVGCSRVQMLARKDLATVRGEMLETVMKASADGRLDAAFGEVRGAKAATLPSSDRDSSHSDPELFHCIMDHHDANAMRMTARDQFIKGVRDGRLSCALRKVCSMRHGGDTLSTSVAHERELSDQGLEALRQQTLQELSKACLDGRLVSAFQRMSSWVTRADGKLENASGEVVMPKNEVAAVPEQVSSGSDALHTLARACIDGRLQSAMQHISVSAGSAPAVVSAAPERNVQHHAQAAVRMKIRDELFRGSLDGRLEAVLRQVRRHAESVNFAPSSAGFEVDTPSQDLKSVRQRMAAELKQASSDGRLEVAAKEVLSSRGALEQDADNELEALRLKMLTELTKASMDGSLEAAFGKVFAPRISARGVSAQESSEASHGTASRNMLDVRRKTFDELSKAVVDGKLQAIFQELSEARCAAEGVDGSKLGADFAQTRGEIDETRRLKPRIETACVDVSKSAFDARFPREDFTFLRETDSARLGHNRCGVPTTGPEALLHVPLTCGSLPTRSSVTNEGTHLDPPIVLAGAVVPKPPSAPPSRRGPRPCGRAGAGLSGLAATAADLTPRPSPRSVPPVQTFTPTPKVPLKDLSFLPVIGPPSRALRPWRSTSSTPRSARHEVDISANGESFRRFCLRHPGEQATSGISARERFPVSDIKLPRVLSQDVHKRKVRPSRDMVALAPTDVACAQVQPPAWALDVGSQTLLT
eukprot:TRINITY_DN20547_c0_g1_i1.p1 TRINITY_DN20547_c0_g1~~TRINITY_DN20547_c0_g1_i1.p1  ORF type:complete len:1212 (+),score=173.30 TRINITY_DN20547_c0_g1_i1:243-3638(+)